MALKQAPVKAQQPTEVEVDVAEVFVTPPVLVAQAVQPAETQTPMTLPSTASPFTSVALAGLMIGGFGLMLLFFAKRIC